MNVLQNGSNNLRFCTKIEAKNQIDRQEEPHGMTSHLNGLFKTNMKGTSYCTLYCKIQNELEIRASQIREKVFHG